MALQRGVLCDSARGEERHAVARGVHDIQLRHPDPAHVSHVHVRPLRQRVRQGLPLHDWLTVTDVAGGADVIG